MRCITYLVTALLFAAVMTGCSTKQVNETADSITGDIKNFGEKVTEQR